jgi:hypothetical protein
VVLLCVNAQCISITLNNYAEKFQCDLHVYSRHQQFRNDDGLGYIANRYTNRSQYSELVSGGWFYGILKGMTLEMKDRLDRAN